MVTRVLLSLCFLTGSVYGTSYYIVQGNSQTACLDSTDPKCTSRAVDESEEWNVRCCADTNPRGWSMYSDGGCSVYSKSRIQGTCHTVSWAAAVQICEGVGARLCTRDELEYPQLCANSIVCGFDNQMVWSSTEESVTLSQDYYIVQGYSEADCVDTIDSTCVTRAVSSDERWNVACCSDTDPGSWRQHPGCSNFVTHNVPDCVSTDWESAAELCSAAGGRLCSVEEIESGCVKSSQCGYNGEMVWSSTSSTESGTSPNIVFIMADDLGHNDLSVHGAEYPTPNIDALFTDGYEFKNFYVQPVCAPSRVAFMSMRYPFRYGLSLSAKIMPSTPAHLPVSASTWASLLPEEYTNHYIGKWHLGYASTAYLPTARGFHEYLAYLNGVQDYNTHTISYPVNGSPVTAYDLWYDGPLVDDFTAVDRLSADQLSSLTGVESEVDVHNNELFIGRALDILANVQEPFTITFSPQDPHSPLVPAPDGRLDETYNCSLVDSTANRMTYCEQVSLLDDSVRQIVDALHNNGLWENTYVIFVTDNGGSVDSGSSGLLASAASNFPLRGGKSTLFEGGVKGVMTIAGGALADEYVGQKNYDLHHAVDVPVTMLALAGQTVTGVDGIDMFSSEIHDELFLNIEDETNTYAYRKNEMKFVMGSAKTDGWYEHGFDHTEATFNCVAGCVFNLTSDIKETTNLMDTPVGTAFYNEAMVAINSIVNDGEYLFQQENMFDACLESITTDPGYWSPWDDADPVTCTVA